MGQRRHDPAGRCARCAMRRELCICGRLPRVRSRVRIVLVRHHVEAYKTTNTGRVVALCLEGCTVHTWRGRGEPLDLPPLDPASTFVLFPRWEGPTVPAARLARVARPTVVVADGTWRQAGRIVRRLPALKGLPAVTIPVTAPRHPTLRAERNPGSLPTAEAVALLLREAGEHEAAEALWEGTRLMVDAVLRARGTPRSAR